ncbi:MAG: glycosyltransferase family 4 protein [Bacteroidetes bacterium]|nr:glycosyltransferase family 4 protein [Bacteroidota bacterium]
MPLKILFLTIAKNQASYKYRVEQFFPFWKDFNTETVVISLVGLGFFSKLRLALRTGKYDVVILQKKTLHPILIRIIKKRSLLVFDFDDALYAKPYFHTGKLKPKHPGSAHTLSRLNFILSQADLVFAGSKALYDYSVRLNPNCCIIPTAYSAPLKTQNPEPADPSKPVQVGWIGGTKNLVYLSIIEGVLLQLQAEGLNFELVIISGEYPSYLLPKFRFIQWDPVAEDEFLRSIDVGIMPLADDEWSKGKCAFKLLQYMAYSKPVIASDVGENTSAVIQGQSGYLANSPEEWGNALRNLITNPDLRIKMGKAGFEHFSKLYSRPVVQQKIMTELENKLNRSQLKPASGE